MDTQVERMIESMKVGNEEDRNRMINEFTIFRMEDRRIMREMEERREKREADMEEKRQIREAAMEERREKREAEREKREAAERERERERERLREEERKKWDLYMMSLIAALTGNKLPPPNSSQDSRNS